MLLSELKGSEGGDRALSMKLHYWKWFGAFVLRPGLSRDGLSDKPGRAAEGLEEGGKEGGPMGIFPPLSTCPHNQSGRVMDAVGWPSLLFLPSMFSCRIFSPWLPGLGKLGLISGKFHYLSLPGWCGSCSQASHC